MSTNPVLPVGECLYLQPHMDQTIKPGDWYYDTRGLNRQPELCTEVHKYHSYSFCVRIPTLPDLMSFARELAEVHEEGFRSIELIAHKNGNYGAACMIEEYEEGLGCVAPTAALALVELIKKIMEVE